jgi:hypothetical protein
MVMPPTSPAAWGDPAAYTWDAGSAGFISNASAATLELPGAMPLAVNVGDFAAVGQRPVMIEQTSAGGGFTVYEARHPDDVVHRLQCSA